MWYWTYSVCSLTVDSIECYTALRAVATVVKMEDDRRLFHNAALRKRRKEVTEHMDAQRRSGSSKVHNYWNMPPSYISNVLFAVYHRNANGIKISSNGVSCCNVHSFSLFPFTLPMLQPNST
jgi:hypothetical protein